MTKRFCFSLKRKKITKIFSICFGPKPETRLVLISSALSDSHSPGVSAGLGSEGSFPRTATRQFLKKWFVALSLLCIFSKQYVKQNTLR